MGDLLEQHLVALKRGLEASFVALALNGHSQEVGCALEEGNSWVLNSCSDRLSTSSTPNGLPSPCRMTFMAR
jgi:hypothetical protein